MKLLDAAFEVLHDAGTPLDKQEIVRRILARGLWSTKGKTPQETVRRDIQSDIHKHGEASRFQQVGPSIFTLSGEHKNSPASSTRTEVKQTTADQPATSLLTFVDAAERVLRESAERQPLHYREITRRALEMGYLQTESKVPESTLNALVGVEIRQREARGDAQRFIRPERGLIGLAEELPTTLATQIEEHNNSVREQVRRRLHEGSPVGFEQLVASLLIKIGFTDAEPTRYYKDGGIDARGTLVVADVVRLRIAVQAKRWKTNVQAPVIREVRGSLSVHEQGLIITTSDFSKSARDEATRAGAAPVALMNGEQLIDLLVKYEEGVTKTTHSLLQILEE